MDIEVQRLQTEIDTLQERLRKTELEMVSTQSDLKQLHRENLDLKTRINNSEERFRTGVNRLIWLVGGGLISGLLTFIMKGGLNNVG